MVDNSELPSYDDHVSELIRIAHSNKTTNFPSTGGDELFMTAVLHYGLMAYDPSLMLDCLRPLTLRSRISTAQFKPIPHNDRIDLEAFRCKTVDEWNMDDVIGWMISVAKRHKIPVEDMNMHRFANCTGSLLTLMDQKNFVDRDGTYGSLLFNEFCRFQFENLSNPGTSSASASRWFRTAGVGAASRRSNAATATNGGLHISGVGVASHYQQQPSTSSFNVKDLISTDSDNDNNNYARRHSVIKSAPGKSITRGKTIGENVGKVWGGKGKRMKNVEEELPKVVRKRAQRTTGNKLWEFIRDILIESESAPSVVRWENKSDGVFRIIDSEHLARLWGAKKSNRNMTYEKLSRAMRTYYEKKILVPVPKTGLYPKKLVYKFGPNATGLSTTSSNNKSINNFSPVMSSASFRPPKGGKGKTMPTTTGVGLKNVGKYETISDDDEVDD